MKGKEAIVTGATDGIGKVTAREIAKMGASVTVVGRNASKGEAVVRELRAVAGHDKVHFVAGDLSTRSGVRVAADAIRVTRNIVSMPSLAQYRPEEFRPGLEFQRDEELARAAGDIATTIFHPVGTCKMGCDDAAVVDPRLKVHGLQGLRVADASIMPAITSGNTNSPTLMIAEKAAAMILEDARG